MILVPRPLASYKYNESVSYSKFSDSASITPILLQWELCHFPVLQRLQLMLPHLVLIERSVCRLFSICKCCGKGNCEKATVGSRGGPGMAAIFGPGGPIILPWTVRGDHFRGGTVHGVTVTFAFRSVCNWDQSDQCLFIRADQGTKMNCN